MTTEVHDPYETIIDDLAYSYDGVFSHDDVAGTVKAARQALEAAATITQFLPVLVAKQAKEFDWDFVFLGADQDAVLTASDLGITADKAMTYARGKGNVAAMNVALTGKLRSVRSGRRDDGFTDDERRAAGGNQG